MIYHNHWFVPDVIDVLIPVVFVRASPRSHNIAWHVKAASASQGTLHHHYDSELLSRAKG
jgi:hypothetical protein